MSLNTNVFYGSRAQRRRDYIVPELHDDSDPNEEVDSGDDYEPQANDASSSEDEHENVSKRSGQVNVKRRNVRKQAVKDDEVEVDETTVNNTNATWSKLDITNTPLPDYKHEVPTHIKEPFQYFCQLFTAEMLESLVFNTNLYATQKDVNTNFNTTSEELMQFVGILIFMSMDTLPSLEDYWSHNHCHPDITTVMTSKRFRSLRTAIHINDNTKATADRFHKVRPLFEGLRKACLTVPGTPKQSVDEVMVGYKGTRAGNLRQYIRTKPDKWGFKLFCRASDDGFIHDIMMYQGQTTFDYHSVSLTEEEKKMPISSKVVICLAKTMDHTKTSAIYADNFFTSLPLVKYLHATFNCRYTGTARDNRIGKPPLMSVNDMEKTKVKRSAMDYCSLDSVLAVRWKDNKVVTILTNDIGINPVTKIRRYSKELKQKVEVDCPAVIKNYNAHMGGIDKNDMLVHLYKSPLKTKRWYMRLFGYVIDLCCVNGWLLYRRECGVLKEKYMNLKEFRFSISKSARKSTNGIPRSLRSPSCSTSRSSSRSSSVDDIPNRHRKRSNDTIFDETQKHWPVSAKRLSCKHCNTKNKRTYSSFACSFCKVNLCLNSMRNCFLEFHRQQHA
ncbi:piggyBac transposable element-derived protein 3-like [Cherax quadricarinatus]|uniref:piggyBac transposable element-derived protein 3-like n=1 Tax=Cherax quadricarinatus TaxID=27406 RepID=UPI00387E3C20